MHNFCKIKISNCVLFFKYIYPLKFNFPKINFILPCPLIEKETLFFNSNILFVNLISFISDSIFIFVNFISCFFVDDLFLFF